MGPRPNSDLDRLTAVLAPDDGRTGRDPAPGCRAKEVGCARAVSAPHPGDVHDNGGAGRVHSDVGRTQIFQPTAVLCDGGGKHIRGFRTEQQVQRRRSHIAEGNPPEVPGMAAR